MCAVFSYYYASFKHSFVAQQRPKHASCRHIFCCDYTLLMQLSQSGEPHKEAQQAATHFYHVHWPDGALQQISNTFKLNVVPEVHWPSVPSNAKGFADRKQRTWSVLRELLPAPRGFAMLDIGGVDFAKMAAEAGWHYNSIDIEIPQQHGTGGYQSDAQLTYDGRNLPFEKDSYDVVNVGFVLHHAAQNTLPLLMQVARIARKYVLIGEDVADVDYPLAWHERNHQHQPGGIFRSMQEWEILFRCCGMEPLVKYVVHRSDDLDARTYRCVYVLARL